MITEFLRADTLIKYMIRSNKSRAVVRNNHDILGGRQFSVLSADVGFGKDYIFSSLFSSYITRSRYASWEAKWNHLTHSGPRDLQLSKNKIHCLTFALIDMESADIVHGACLRGQITLSVPRNALPKFTGICHCLDCKTASGTLYVHFPTFQEQYLTLKQIYSQVANCY